MIIEGGSFTLQQFIDKNLWDEAYIFRNPNLELLNGTKAPKLDFKPENIENLRETDILFFRNNPTAKKSEFIHADIVTAIINNIKYIFKTEEKPD